ncbi:MAG: phosphatase PAP2 family protein [Massilia sp.]
MRRYFPTLYRHVAARFAPDTTFGLHLTVGLALLWLATWIFGEIASDVVAQARITIVDVQVSMWFHQHLSDGWTAFMLFITNWNSPMGVLCMSVVFAGFLYGREARYWLATLVLAISGGFLLNILLKYFYHRARPSFDHPLLTLSSYSFPSGHATGATLFYGMVAAYLVCVCRGWAARAAVAVVATLMVALVALSRIYLGAHYLSDVLGAIAISCGWLAVCITGISTLRRRRAARVTE